jgi:hypothetical protein
MKYFYNLESYFLTVMRSSIYTPPAFDIKSGSSAIIEFKGLQARDLHQR